MANTSGVVSTINTDGRVNERIANYTAFSTRTLRMIVKNIKKNRLENYTDVVNGYYDGATELYEYGWAKSFHFSRFYKGEGFEQSLARHEHYLALQMGLKPGMRVLDVGCGVGGPAREIARFAGVKIVGVNNNDFQIGRARKYTEKAGLSSQLEFVKGDFMTLSEMFGKESFDAVYAIEATVHAPTFEGVYGEILKVLNRMFGCYEWVMSDEWDPSIPEHKAIAHGIEIGDGIAEMRNIASARKALKTVGFNVEMDQDLADMGDEIPWYYPLEGDIRKAQTFWDYFVVFRMTWLGMFITHNVLWLMQLLHLVPQGTFEVGETLKAAGAALVRGGQTGLFTPMALFIARKPASSSESS